MAKTTPPGKPWIEGGGPGAPYVLRWAPAGGPSRIVGYVVEKRVIGGGDGTPFKQLTGNTGSKAPRFGLLSSHVEPGSSYMFRVAALMSSAPGHQQQGAFSEASEPLEALLPVGTLSSPSLGVGARLNSSVGNEGPSLAIAATGTVAAAKEEMEAWERQYEKKHGARPTVSDKVSSREYQQLAKKHKQLRRASSPRDTAGAGAGEAGGDREAGGCGGHRGHSRHGGGGHRGGGGGGGREERSRRGGKESTELTALRDEERKLGRSLDRWAAWLGSGLTGGRPVRVILRARASASTGGSPRVGGRTSGLGAATVCVLRLQPYAFGSQVGGRL